MDETVEAVEVSETPEEKKHVSTWVIIAAFAVLLAFLGLIYWGLTHAKQGPVSIGQKVPGFDLVTFDGQRISTDELSGKVVVVNFWASWCTPCESEAAELEQAWQTYKPGGQVVFLGVDYVDTEPEALGYLQKFNITYPNGPDLRTSISQLFRIRGVPETYILDAEGRLASIQIGPFQSLDEILGTIDGVLQSQ